MSHSFDYQGIKELIARWAPNLHTYNEHNERAYNNSVLSLKPADLDVCPTWSTVTVYAYTVNKQLNGVKFEY